MHTYIFELSNTFHNIHNIFHRSFSELYQTIKYETLAIAEQYITNFSKTYLIKLLTNNLYLEKQ